MSLRRQVEHMVADRVTRWPLVEDTSLASHDELANQHGCDCPWCSPALGRAFPVERR